MLTPDQFLRWGQLMRELAGLHFPESKAYLFEQRLCPLLEQFGCGDLEDLYQRVRLELNGELGRLVVEKMTTHETSFFRDGKPFDMFRSLAQDMARARRFQPYKRMITVWSAGCSTGEEPYSLAIILHEVLRQHPSLRFYIEATDIATHTLEAAREGIFKQLDGRISSDRLDRYFDPEEGVGWRVNQKLRGWVHFKQGNLLEEVARSQTFDFIFCRNVAIYFHADVRRTFFDRLSQQISPDGALIVGASESVNSRHFTRCQTPNGYYFTPNL